MPGTLTRYASRIVGRQTGPQLHQKHKAYDTARRQPPCVSALYVRSASPYSLPGALTPVIPSNLALYVKSLSAAAAAPPPHVTALDRLVHPVFQRRAAAFGRGCAAAADGAVTDIALRIGPLSAAARPAAVVLGIESSCDDTGVAVVTSDGIVLGEAIATQADVHAQWGEYRSGTISGLSSWLVSWVR